MSKDECPMTKEARRTNVEGRPPSGFVIWASTFFRHSSFDLRHSPRPRGRGRGENKGQSHRVRVSEVSLRQLFLQRPQARVALAQLGQVASPVLLFAQLFV